jgi:hypothetical protein
MRIRIAIAALVAVLAAMSAVLVVAVVKDSSLQRQEAVIVRHQTTLARQLVRAENAELSLKRAQAKLRNEVSGINAPSDPLSAYNDVCNQAMTNSNSGATQTYYFPCTNQATTIPEPGY